MGNLKVEIEPVQDRHGSNYYIGRLDAPLLFRANEGIAFLIFISEAGSEEIQIAHLDSDNGSYSQYYQQGNQLKIKLVKRIDAEGNAWFLAKVKFEGLIELSDNGSFMAFLSREGKEELQLEAKIVDNKKEPEIYYKRR